MNIFEASSLQKLFRSSITTKINYLFLLIGHIYIYTLCIALLNFVAVTAVVVLLLLLQPLVLLLLLQPLEWRLNVINSPLQDIRRWKHRETQDTASDKLLCTFTHWSVMINVYNICIALVKIIYKSELVKIQRIQGRVLFHGVGPSWLVR